jgi:Concanavalin A-like lectin/glucanases superfamily
MNQKFKDKDLVLHLDLRRNQGKRPVDESNINFCQGTGTTMVHERNGYRFSSGGTDVIDCGDKDPINVTTQLTFSVWIYMNGTISGIGKQTSGSSGFAYVVAYNTDNKVYFQMTGNGTTVAYGNTTTTYPTNQWVHVVCTYNGGGSTNADKLKIYYNGREITGLAFVGTIPTSIFRTSAALRVNVLNGVTYGNGKMGLIRMFKRALNHAEVMSEYVNTKATNK